MNEPSICAAPKSNGWIFPRDKLPPNSNNVIVATSNGEVTTGFYFASLSCWDWNGEREGGLDDASVLAWQPFPAPLLESDLQAASNQGVEPSVVDPEVEMLSMLRSAHTRMEYGAELLRIRALLSGQAEFKQDPMDIVRTLCGLAAEYENLTAEQMEVRGHPLSPMSPLIINARVACLERGFAADGLATDEGKCAPINRAEGDLP